MRTLTPLFLLIFTACSASNEASECQPYPPGEHLEGNIDEVPGDDTGNGPGDDTGVGPGDDTGNGPGDDTGVGPGDDPPDDIEPPPTCPEHPLAEAPGRITYVCDCLPGADADCIAGDDDHTGDSPDAPLQTWPRARQAFADLDAGDMLAFCRGGAFDATEADVARWVNGSCTADAPCVVRDYEAPWGSGDEVRPHVEGAVDRDLFDLSDAGNSEHEEGYVFLNLSLEGQRAGRGFFIRNDIDDVVMCNLAIDSFAVGVYVGSEATGTSSGSDGENENILLRNSTITNNTHQGWLGACDDCALEFNEFHNNAYEYPVFGHNIYISGGPHRLTQNIRVVGNDLYRSAMVDGHCSATSLVVHSEHGNLLIEGNTVREDPGTGDGNGCWGIVVNPSHAGSTEQFPNLTIRGNTVMNVGRVAIGVASCDPCLIENNVISLQGDITRSAIRASVEDDREALDMPMDNVTIRNNSIFIAEGRGQGVELKLEGDNHVVVSNSIHYAGTESRFACFDIPLPDTAIDAMDHNLCYAPSAPGTEWVEGQGSREDWHAQTGFDGSSLEADPGYHSLDMAAPDLFPSSPNSPVVDGGHATRSSGYDIDGIERTELPDIGAYERVE